MSGAISRRMGKPPGGKCGFDWKRVDDGCVATENKRGRRDSQEIFNSNTQKIMTKLKI
ncbi:hypothetical protein ACFL4P_01830 [Gemmatimonadota bacterium]